MIVVVNAGFVTFHVVQCLNKFRPAAHTCIWPQIDHLLQTCASRTILNCIKFNYLIRNKLITSWFYESQNSNSGICQNNLWTNQKIHDWVFVKPCLVNSFNRNFFPKILGVKADYLNCYKCTGKDSWCDDLDEIIDQGENAITGCSSNKCLISGNLKSSLE